MTGENENTEDLNIVLTAIGNGIADRFGFKITRLGGLSKIATARGMCALRSLPQTCDDAWGDDIIAAACAHIGATVEPSRFEGAWIAQEYLMGHYDSDKPGRYRGRPHQGPNRAGSRRQSRRRCFRKSDRRLWQIAVARSVGQAKHRLSSSRFGKSGGGSCPSLFRRPAMRTPRVCTP